MKKKKNNKKIKIKQIVHPGEKPLSKKDLNKIIKGPIAMGEEEYQKEIRKKDNVSYESCFFYQDLI